MKTTKEIKNNTQKDNSLQIINTVDKKLTKNQQLFNKLTKRIEFLETNLKSENEKLHKILVLYSKKLNPLFKEVAEFRIKLAKSLAQTTFRIKYTEKQLKNIKDVILSLCDDAFQYIEPDDNQKAFFNEWSKTSYNEELNSQAEFTKIMFAKMMKNIHGIDINLDDFDFKSDDFSEFANRVKDEFEKSNIKDENIKEKKTKRQIQYEERIKLEEEIKNRTIRSIYIALAKVIHPDTETDVVLKSEKEEIMKQVTTAYERKDLTALLRLELLWVYKENEHLDQLTEDKLQIYISALKQQVKELEAELNILYFNPRFISIKHLARFPEKSALSSIQKEVKEQINIKNSLIHHIKLFENSNSKKKILDFVKEYITLKNLDDNIEYLMHGFPDFD